MEKYLYFICQIQFILFYFDPMLGATWIRNFEIIIKIIKIIDLDFVGLAFD